MSGQHHTHSSKAKVSQLDFLFRAQKNTHCHAIHQLTPDTGSHSHSHTHGAPSTNSGAINSGVPTTLCAIADLELNTRASPKSPSLTSFSEDRNTFADLMSRWMIRDEWIRESARSSWMSHAVSWGSGRLRGSGSGSLAVAVDGGGSGRVAVGKK
jgi:hypothetical protein